MCLGAGMNGFEESARLFKTLMHPARLEILETLRDGEHCVCHMEAALGYRQAYISQHLSVLREASLVHDRITLTLFLRRVVCRGKNDYCQIKSLG
jgi:DNA-binding transcriptional ArsR family regulator